ncbi:MAG: FecCD family ABC transporter permease [Micrococcaceae bacterium]
MTPPSLRTVARASRASAAASASARSRYRYLGAAGFTLRVERRALRTGALLGVAVLVVSMIAMTLGDYGLTWQQTFSALTGGSTDRLASYFVLEQRLPRVVMAVLVGAALGVSGQTFQSLSGNPLGSPDIIGFTTGAATGAIVQIIVFNAGPLATAAGALAGGLITAVVVYALAWRRGLAGYRLVLVGIGVGLMLQAVNSLLVVRASLTAAQTAAQWLAGSLNAITWRDTLLVGVVVLVLIPVVCLHGRRLTIMRLGDPTALGLGVPVERTRLILVLAGVALVAVATAATGPIAFIALAAPQIARRLTASSGPGFIPAALMGALLVASSDIVAQRLFAPTQLPVGVVSGSLGGVYLLWLLAREWRRTS